MRYLAIVFSGAFLMFLGGTYMFPSLVLGHFQDEFVAAYRDAGVDTSACNGSIPALGIGVQKCYEGSIKDLARKIQEANEEGARFGEDE